METEEEDEEEEVQTTKRGKRKRKRIRRTRKSSIKRYMDEEPEAGIVARKGRSVRSLAVFMESKLQLQCPAVPKYPQLTFGIMVEKEEDEEEEDEEEVEEEDEEEEGRMGGIGEARENGEKDGVVGAIGAKLGGIGSGRDNRQIDLSECVGDEWRLSGARSCCQERHGEQGGDENQIMLICSKEEGEEQSNFDEEEEHPSVAGGTDVATGMETPPEDAMRAGERATLEEEVQGQRSREREVLKPPPLTRVPPPKPPRLDPTLRREEAAESSPGEFPGLRGQALQDDEERGRREKEREGKMEYRNDFGKAKTEDVNWGEDRRKEDSEGQEEEMVVKEEEESEKREEQKGEKKKEEEREKREKGLEGDKEENTEKNEEETKEKLLTEATEETKQSKKEETEEEGGAAGGVEEARGTEGALGRREEDEAGFLARLPRRGAKKKRPLGATFASARRGAGEAPAAAHEEEVCGPKKPPRRSLCEGSLRGLEKEQDPCREHQLPLNFYCATCKEVICRDCTVVTHPHDLHRILDTADALAALRTNALSLLRHYTLVQSFHAALSSALDMYIANNPSMTHACMEIADRLKIESGDYLQQAVTEAEVLVESEGNLHRFSAKIREWEGRQEDWGGVVFLALRCQLLAGYKSASDKVFLRMGDWVIATPWIYLRHLLEPYLPENGATDTANTTLHAKQPSKTSSRSPSPRGREKSFPHDARQMVLHNLLPYVIFNPEIRYFLQISDLRDTEVTLVVEPSSNHVREYLTRRHHAAALSPQMLHRTRAGFSFADDALNIVEKQFMMGGRHKSRLVGSYMAVEGQGGREAGAGVQRVVKVSLPDVTVVDGGRGFPSVGCRKVCQGDVLLEHQLTGRPVLSVALRDISEVSAFHLGHVTRGLDGLNYLIEAEEYRKAETSGLRAKILATVRREEEAVYQVTLGMDI
ncbi:uncharacterized protein LOC134772803 isoform X2 [Penaeus indicus]|uniref:uncharacterized protein LOC134772803 isoform X2 n=1 Tax=Penaeus indicus TaxID=29960 RepID=UPI00300CE180